MQRKVILDVDPGIDDAVAVCMALFAPELDVIAVTAVAGNVSAEQATRNVQAIIEQLDPPRWPRVGAASDPEDGLPLDARHLHGADGLFDNLHEAEIVELVRKGPLADVARGLVERSLERMQQTEPGVPSTLDDLTLIVYRRGAGQAE